MLIKYLAIQRLESVFKVLCIMEFFKMNAIIKIKYNIKNYLTIFYYLRIKN